MLFAKALVPIVITPIFFVLEMFGITPDMTVEQALTVAVTGVITAVGVYMVPNKEK
jgi:uncharacterized membrane protein